MYTVLNKLIKMPKIVFKNSVFYICNSKDKMQLPFIYGFVILGSFCLFLFSLAHWGDSAIALESIPSVALLNASSFFSFSLFLSLSLPVSLPPSLSFSHFFILLFTCLVLCFKRGFLCVALPGGAPRNLPASAPGGWV